MFAALWTKVASDSVIGDQGCPGIGLDIPKTLLQCKLACESKKNCTAIDWRSSDGTCTYRQCSFYPPNVYPQNGWEVWAIATNRKFHDIIKLLSIIIS